MTPTAIVGAKKAVFVQAISQGKKDLFNEYLTSDFVASYLENNCYKAEDVKKLL